MLSTELTPLDNARRNAAEFSAGLAVLAQIQMILADIDRLDNLRLQLLHSPGDVTVYGDELDKLIEESRRNSDYLNVVASMNEIANGVSA